MKEVLDFGTSLATVKVSTFGKKSAWIDVRIEDLNNSRATRSDALLSVRECLALAEALTKAANEAQAFIDSGN